MTNNKTKTLIKPYSLEETKSLVKSVTPTDGDSRDIFDELRHDLAKYQLSPDAVKGKELNVLREKVRKAAAAMSLETHAALSSTVSEPIRPLVMTFAQELESEYRCKTVSERALVEVIVGAYARVIDYSATLREIKDIGYISHEKNGYYSLVSKELDRANRQFLAALQTLRQLKAPPIQFNVKARTAFIAQNQQLNANSKVIESVEVSNDKQ